jgi:hypothetical protein
MELRKVSQMTRKEIVEYVAEWFGIEPDKNGDTYSYDWQSGCAMGGESDKWLTLAEVVNCIETMLNDYGIEDE